MHSKKKTTQPGNTSICSLVIIKVQEVSEDLTSTEEDQASLKTNRFVHFPSPKYNKNLKDVILIFTSYSPTEEESLANWSLVINQRRV